MSQNGSVIVFEIGRYKVKEDYEGRNTQWSVWFHIERTRYGWTGHWCGEFDSEQEAVEAAKQLHADDMAPELEYASWFPIPPRRPELQRWQEQLL